MAAHGSGYTAASFAVLWRKASNGLINIQSRNSEHTAAPLSAAARQPLASASSLRLLVAWTRILSRNAAGFVEGRSDAARCDAEWRRPEPFYLLEFATSEEDPAPFPASCGK
jgi:hypothetical protein